VCATYKYVAKRVRRWSRLVPGTYTMGRPVRPATGGMPTGFRCSWWTASPPASRAAPIPRRMGSREQKFRPGRREKRGAGCICGCPPWPSAERGWCATPPDRGFPTCYSGMIRSSRYDTSPSQRRTALMSAAGSGVYLFNATSSGVS
jgi:hypothetical protein